MSTLAILHVGLPLDYSIIPLAERPRVAERLHRHRLEMQATGLTYEFAYQSPERGLEDFAERLRAVDWDGVIIGGGVTGTPSLAGFMERLVNVAHAAAPRAKIMFVYGVEDVGPAIERWFDV